jgi:hypothetical protein
MWEALAVWHGVCFRLLKEKKDEFAIYKYVVSPQQYSAVDNESVVAVCCGHRNCAGPE